MTRSIYSRKVQGEKSLVPGGCNSTLQTVFRECLRCGRCGEQCSFLRRYGHPGEIAAQHLQDPSTHLQTGYFCSLCRLCTQSCPKSLPVARMFLELRRKAVKTSRGHFREHIPLRFFERVGNSRLFSIRYIPKGCDTLFFPGCTLPGIRPGQTMALYDDLRKILPKLGIVLECCNKPSHDLGRQERFAAMFLAKVDELKKRGVKNILTGCPSCLQVFQKYGDGLRTSLAYSRLDRSRPPRDGILGAEEKVTIHDPCTARFMPEVHREIRELVGRSGKKLCEMDHSSDTTFCCGEGGGAARLGQGNGDQWRQKRMAEVGGHTMITYCAGCTVSLQGEKTIHLIDLLYPELATPKDQRGGWRAYLNRLWVKKKIGEFSR